MSGKYAVSVGQFEVSMLLGTVALLRRHMAA